MIPNLHFNAGTVYFLDPLASVSSVSCRWLSSSLFCKFYFFLDAHSVHEADSTAWSGKVSLKRGSSDKIWRACGPPCGGSSARKHPEAQKPRQWIVLSVWGTASGHAQGEKLPSNQSCWLLSLSTALDFLCQKRILSRVALSDLYCRGSLCVSSGEKTEEEPRQRLQPSSPWDKSGGKCWPLVRGELGRVWSLGLLTDPVRRLRAVNHNCSSRGFSWRHFPQMGKGFIIWWASLYIECWQAEIQVPLGCRCWASMSAPPLPPAEKARYLEEDCPSARLFEA